MANNKLRELKEEHSKKQDSIRLRLEEFSRVESKDYFYELIFCLLTPQSSAKNALKTVEKLKKRKFFEKNFDVSAILGDKKHYIRFHKTKARNLSKARILYPQVSSLLSESKNSFETRNWLVENIVGMGWKEASHFLRNIGHRDLAILDRHILKNLLKYGAIKELPKVLTKKNYMEIEKEFLKFSKEVEISMDELDLLFWSMETGEILK